MAAERRALTLLGIAGRNLRRQPVRTSLTAMGVAVGVVAIVAFGAIAGGLRSATEGAIRISGADMSVFQAGVAADLFSTLDEETTRSLLAALPEVEDSSAVLTHIVPVDGKPFMAVFGVHPHEFGFRDHEPVEGRRMAAEDEVMIGSIVRRVLDKTVGETILIRGEVFKIAGVVRTGVVYFDGGIIVNLRALQRLLDRQGQVTSFQVRLRSGADPDLAAERIERAHPQLIAIASADQYSKVDPGLEIADGMVWAVSFMALVIGSLIVTNTMWMSVNQRIREIGVLRAVGWSRANIIGMIVAEAAGLGLIACLLGCGLGIGLAELTTVLPVTRQYLLPVFDARTFVLALGVAVILSVVGAMLPALRAAGISPVEALRRE